MINIVIMYKNEHIDEFMTLISYLVKFSKTEF